MYSLFNRLKTKRKRVIGERQIEILKMLLEDESPQSADSMRGRQLYASIKDAAGAFMRDIAQLKSIRAINVQGDPANFLALKISINLDWPQEIDEGEFLRRMKAMPKAKTFKFLS
jgi:hypothetical protein